MKPSGDGRCTGTEVRRTGQLHPKRAVLTTQGLVWKKRLLRTLSTEDSVAVINTEDRVLVRDDELQLCNLSIDLCNLIVESRTPGVNERGYGEGVHCPPLFGSNNHQCNPSTSECQHHQILLQRLLHGTNYPSFDIDVMLLPECCQNEQDFQFRDKVLNKEYLLLERWTMDWKIHCQCSGKSMMDIRQLLRAVRSFLHFSQLSAWLSLYQGTSPSNIYYWVKVPGELFTTKFDSKPEVHIFPSVQMSESITATVKVCYRTRTHNVPIIPCLKHKESNQNSAQDSKASSSQFDSKKLCSNRLVQSSTETNFISTAKATNFVRTRILPVAVKCLDITMCKEQIPCNSTVSQGIHKENQLHSITKMSKNSDESDFSQKTGIKTSVLRRESSSHEGQNAERKRHSFKRFLVKKSKIRKLKDSVTTEQKSGEASAYDESKSLIDMSNEKSQRQCHLISNGKVDAIVGKKRKSELCNENSSKTVFTSQKKYRTDEKGSTSSMPSVYKISSLPNQISRLSSKDITQVDESNNKSHDDTVCIEKITLISSNQDPECSFQRKISMPRVLRDVKNTPETIVHEIEQIAQSDANTVKLLKDPNSKETPAHDNCKTGNLPLPSSPVPQRRSIKPFNYVATGMQRILLGAGEHTSKDQKKTEFFKRRKLLGNFEESILNGCLQPIRSVEGFKIEIGASGSFCPNHVTLPVEVQFYELNNCHRGTSPYVGRSTLDSVEYHVPKKGAVQVTLFNPSGTVIKMFVVNYDLTAMPPMCHTFIRQRIFYLPVGVEVVEPPKSLLRYVIHLRFTSSPLGKLFLHKDIKILVMNNSDVDAASIHSEKQYELCSFTEMPTNPSFSSYTEH